MTFVFVKVELKAELGAMTLHTTLVKVTAGEAVTLTVYIVVGNVCKNGMFDVACGPVALFTVKTDTAAFSLPSILSVAANTS